MMNIIKIIASAFISNRITNYYKEVHFKICNKKNKIKHFIFKYESNKMFVIVI
jgi:hypothetical protein